MTDSVIKVDTFKDRTNTKQVDDDSDDKVLSEGLGSNHLHKETYLLEVLETKTSGIAKKSTFNL